MPPAASLVLFKHMT